MNIEALQFTSRFSLPPNSLGYCGRDTAPAKFIRLITEGVDTGVQKELEKFITLHPYLQTLSRITGLSWLSHEVAEAYWLGNDHLKKVRPEHYLTLLDNFSRQGVPSWLVEELRHKPPGKFIPTHLFQILHVGVGRSLEKTPMATADIKIETINNCMIRWGRVEDISPKQIKVSLNSLVKNGSNYQLALLPGSFSYRPDFLPGLEKGRTVAVHWGQPVKLLTMPETSAIDYWTRQTLEGIYY
jgi:hypothetical protein